MKTPGMAGVIAPVYQPIISLKTGEVLYFESLARSTAKKSHTELLQFLEDYRLIHLVDGTMIDLAAQSLMRFPDIRIGVNVSVATVEQRCGHLVSTLFEHLPLARRFVIEITETLPIRDRATVRTFIEAVKIAGATVAFDDFGDGNFTLNNIRDFRPHIVKLSEAMIRDRHSRADEIRSVVAVAAGTGMKVVAEAIDTEEKREDCRRLGIGYVQGYLVGYPSSYPEILASPVVELGLRAAAAGAA